MCILNPGFAYTMGMKTLIAHIVVCALALASSTAFGQSAEAFTSAYERGDWAAAAESAELWAEGVPQSAIAPYNAACAHARAGNTAEALDWLSEAGERGFAGVRSIEEDPDLDSVRSNEGFAGATARIRDNRARLFEAFKAEAEASEIFTIVPDGLEAGKPVPLILVLHGYGGTPEPVAELYREVAEEFGAIVAAPSAIRPGPNGQGFSWTFRDEAEWWALRAIERVSAEHDIDPDRVILSGFSQGANLTLAVGLKHPKLFAGLLPVCGHYQPHLMPTPKSDAPRLYLMIGDLDPWADTFRDARRVFDAAGLEVRLRVNVGVGHAYPLHATRELSRALKFLLEE